MKELLKEIESKLESLAHETNELEHGINYDLTSEIDLDGVVYDVEYTCDWIHEDSSHDYPGYDGYTIQIDFITLVGEVNRIIYEKGGKFEALKNLKPE